jgi:hypothetical protein
LSQPQISVQGARPDDARRVEYWVSRAAAALELDDLRVTVRGRLRAESGVQASASPGEIWIRRQLLKGNDDRLGFVLYEEVAHCKLFSLGVRGERMLSVLGPFLHELFAGWYQYHQLVTVDGRDPSRMVAFPIPPGRPSTVNFAYQLGKMVGGALAGSSQAAAQLTRWRDEGKAEPSLLALVTKVERTLEGETDPIRFAERVARIYSGESSPSQRHAS